ncbi:hypothetical protein Scep_016987 [Stephania cephalantha]|uniref:X8 domain-containing protein n=1 Tax=Stephania cephalantha TaxID=152367 RepID=A0AAP0INR3_9MAGN
MSSRLVLSMVLLALASGCSEGAWCTCRSDVSDSALQKTLDYACGAGADCNPILQNGPCFQPNTVRAHCSYAVNSYFQKKGQGPGTCEFSNTAIVTQSDPSPGGTCSFPSSASAAGTGTTNTPTGTGTGTGTGGTSSTTPAFNPNSQTPGVMGGGIGTGLGPSGTGIGTDPNDAPLQNINLFSLFVLLICGLVF